MEKRKYHIIHSSHLFYLVIYHSTGYMTSQSFSFTLILNICFEFTTLEEDGIVLVASPIDLLALVQLIFPTVSSPAFSEKVSIHFRPE